MDRTRRGHAGQCDAGERRRDPAGTAASLGLEHQASRGKAAVMRSFALAIVAATACGGGAKPAAPAPKQQAAVDEGTAEKDAKGLLQEIYQTIQQADTDGLMTLFAVPLVVYGPRKSDAHANRADALVALKAIVDPKKKKPVVKSGQLTIVASPGGHSAWAFDVVEVGGQAMTLTAVLSNADDVWQLSARRSQRRRR